MQRVSLAIACAFFLTSAPAFAQSNADQGVGVGVKGGLIFANTDAIASNTNTGFIGGLWFGNRDGVLGMQGEILYAKKGSTTNGVATDLYFLEIPVMLRLNIGHVYGIAGPAFDILLKGAQNDLDVKSNFNELNVSFVGGGGVEVARFLIEMRAMWGLRNLSITGLPEFHDRSLAVLVGLRFN